MRSSLDAAAGLLSPCWCLGCRMQDTVLCTACAQDLRLLTREAFSAEQGALGLPLLMGSSDALSADHSSGTPEIRVLPVTAAGRYEGLLAHTVLSYKDHGAIGLGRVLAPALGRSLHAALLRAKQTAPGLNRVLLVTPPPSLGSRLRRGFDPLQTLLDRVLDSPARQEAMELLPGAGLLRQTRSAALHSILPHQGRQKARGARARRSQLVGTLGVTDRGESVLAGAHVLLVDDVLTSGSTLAELHRMLLTAGATVHGAAVLAAAPAPGRTDSTFCR